MTFYRRPIKLTQMINRFVSWLASLGLTSSDTVTLEVKGRRSGVVRSNPVTWVEHDGERYLVSPRGEAEWVRNVRAAGGEVEIRRRGRERVRLEEVPAEERAPIIQAYLAKTARATRQHFGIDPKTARATRQHFGVDPKAEPAEFETIAGRHPVFRIVMPTQGQAKS